MRIDALLLPLSSLNRVGGIIAKYLSKLLQGDRVFDLLLHKPLRAENIVFCPRVFEVQNDELIVLKLKIVAHIKPDNARKPHKIQGICPSGYVNLVFFKIYPSQLQKMPIGAEVAVLGYFQRNFVGKTVEFQISHPQEILPVAQIEQMPRISVIYPLSAGITQKFLSQKIKEILNKIKLESEEWIDVNFLKIQGWPNFYEAIQGLHFLGSSSNQISQKRLAYDELLAWQIALNLAKKNSNRRKNFDDNVKNSDFLSENLSQKFLDDLPFKPTNSQLKAIDEIKLEIFSDKKMLRLLQGDVGSGKTIVAIAACLFNLSLKKQSCVIVPITILAKQHFSYFKRLLEKFDIKIELLISATTKKQKSVILEKLANGEIDILISTHAVLEDDVKFKNLGLAVIDEQHRFGVMQRLKLVEKGVDVDVLLMSATPIPRSLMMGLYGDMDISILDEKPKNRQEIETLVMSKEKQDDLYKAAKRAIDKGEKIYWICPAIEEMENLPEAQLLEESDLSNVKNKHQELVKIFGEENVGLIHGKMKEKEKESMMLKFIAGDFKILVATTVIEVGIDVSDATIIFIENAEMFGLSQLHQLRGRVGRSEKKSFCILLYGKKYGSNGKKRLNILRESNDGFYIAEEDLKMRGSGDLLGTKQSGLPEFKIADLSLDSDLLRIANSNAKLILNDDEGLKNLQSKKYQDLLRLFGYDDCLRVIGGG